MSRGGHLSILCWASTHATSSKNEFGQIEMACWCAFLEPVFVNVFVGEGVWVLVRVGVGVGVFLCVC